MCRKPLRPRPKSTNAAWMLGSTLTTLPFIDVSDVVVLARALDVELFKDSVFNDRDPAFFRLRTLINISCFILNSFLCSAASMELAGLFVLVCLRDGLESPLASLAGDIAPCGGVCGSPLECLPHRGRMEVLRGSVSYTTRLGTVFFSSSRR